MAYTIIEVSKKTGVSPRTLREYINLAIKGDSTLKERLEMIKEEKSRIELDEIKSVLLCVDKKIEFYETAIKAKSDPHAKGGKKCE
ncbi:hypothetical protein YZ82_02965 [Campylobacter hyointestinalis]|uniref:MerR family transcriptional regulator n=1 Tax=Campylobacter hyointestinalis TaxID=198 RepID=A0A562XIF4_CAMHY|nr:hypothetical protein [Campylobacter hyointestinalis]TWO21962.1 hypothetical protein YZ82_02965 [Campylobacter hyointestinalis]